MELPLAGVETFPPCSFCITMIGVLSNTAEHPGDLGSIRVIVRTGVSHPSDPPPVTAIGVLVTSSLAERGSDIIRKYYLRNQTVLI